MIRAKRCFPGTAWHALPVLCLLLSAIFSSRLATQRMDMENREEITAAERVMAGLSRNPALSFGFRNFLADVTWLQAVQVAGSKKMSHGDYDRLSFLVEEVANYDPLFDVPYLLGGLILGESPAHGRAAISILSRGRAQFPGDWHFPFYIGFTYYFSLGESAAGGMAMADAARLPGSPAYLAGLASRMLSEAKNPEAALRLLEPIYRQENDPARRAVLDRRIRDVAVERDLQSLERAAERYREKTGVNPGDLSDLVREGILAAIPREPNGGRYILERGGKVRSNRVSQRLRVFQSK